MGTFKSSRKSSDRKRRNLVSLEEPASSQSMPNDITLNPKESKTQKVKTLASVFRRIYGFGIDILILYSIIVFSKRIFGDAVWAPDAAIQDIFILIGYFILPTGIWGRTPGKWVAGIKVVTEDGLNPGVAIAIPREVLGRWVSIFAFGIGLIWILFDKRNQGWHDKIAGTIVIETFNEGGPALLRRLLFPKKN